MQIIYEFNVFFYYYYYLFYCYYLQFSYFNKHIRKDGKYRRNGERNKKNYPRKNKTTSLFNNKVK